MPSHIQLKKDASNGETPRGAVRTQRSVGIRMEQSGMVNTMSPYTESIGMRREPGELKHLSSRRKRKKKYRFCE